MDHCLEEFLKNKPAIFAVIRPIEAAYFNKIDWKEPMLDVGCGDGFFAGATFPGKLIDVGIEPSAVEVEKAKKSGVYKEVICTFADKIPFPDGYFGSAFANCVVEHIDDDVTALKEISRVLKPGAIFALGVPSVYLESMLWGGRFLGQPYKNLFTRIFRHKHYHSLEDWQSIFADAGFKVLRYNYYVNERGLHDIEKAHYTEVYRVFLKKFFGRWVFNPEKRLKKAAPKYTRMLNEVLEKEINKGAYIFFVCEKI